MKNRLLISLLASLTLGLAPFLPEPHIWKQIENIINGSFDRPLDWFDLLLHGSPWIWLFFEIVRSRRSAKRVR